jgi:hypothetical protein
MNIPENISQVMIFLFGAASIWLVGRREKWRRWGYIIGLCGHPFWFYSVIMNEQWGILLLVIFNTYSWAQGVYNFWLK